MQSGPENPSNSEIVDQFCKQNEIEFVGRGLAYDYTPTWAVFQSK